jgi:hypothetical protein
MSVAAVQVPSSSGRLLGASPTDLVVTAVTGGILDDLPEPAAAGVLDAAGWYDELDDPVAEIGCAAVGEHGGSSW